MKRKKSKRDKYLYITKKRDPPVNSRKFIIGLAVIGILIILIVISFSNKKQETNILVTTTTTISPLECKECIYEVNRITNKENVNIKECDNIKDNNLRELCTFNIVLKDANLKSDPSYCNILQDITKIEGCKDNVIFNKALLAKNKALCDQIKTQSVKELCKNNIK